MLSITASAFNYNVLESKPSTIALSPFVKDSDPSATLAFDLVSTHTHGQVGVNPASGLVTYTPSATPVAQDSFQYFATDSDNLTSATVTVTLNLSSVAANFVVVSEVEGQSAIDLTVLNLPGAVEDTSTKPTYTFSNVQVGEGTVSFTDTKDGTFAYTPASPSFTGDVTISYQVSDATGTSASTVEIDIGPIAADPVTWGTLSTRMRRSPRRPFPAC